MSVLLIIGGVIVALVLAVIRALAVEEVRGRIQRRIRASVDTTIAALPSDLQAEWGEEWHSELAALAAMPLTAALFARGLRQTASELAAEPIPATLGTQAGSPWSRTQGMAHRLLSGWLRRDQALLYALAVVLANILTAISAVVAGLFNLIGRGEATVTAIVMTVLTGFVIAGARAVVRWGTINGDFSAPRRGSDSRGT